MKFGVPKESLRNEHRVGLTPFAVSRLVELGHQVFVEHEAGADSHFTDHDFAAAGALVVYQADEVWGRADVICRVGSLSDQDVRRLRPETTVCGFLQLGMASREVVRVLQEREVTLIGYELIEDRDGSRPLLSILSEIVGQMVPHIAAHLLQHESGGRGLLLGGIGGITPATAVVLGAGTVGSVAAARLSQAGSHVIVLDNDVERLRRIVAKNPHIHTALAIPRHLRRFTAFADVFVGAIFIPGGRVPWLVTEDMVRNMKPGSVILDISIDQGGCVETSRPTTLELPTFKAHGVLHYCVPNMTSNIPRAASRAIGMGTLRYLERIGALGVDEALRVSRSLQLGTYFYRGQAVQEAAAGALGLEFQPLRDLLAVRPVNVTGEY
jgi:alanine dehydrogenase